MTLHDNYRDYTLEDLNSYHKKLFKKDSFFDLLCRGYTLDYINSILSTNYTSYSKYPQVEDVDRYLYKITFCKKYVKIKDLEKVLSLYSDGASKDIVLSVFPVRFHKTTPLWNVFLLLGLDQEYKSAYAKHQISILRKNMQEKYGVPHNSYLEKNKDNFVKKTQSEEAKNKREKTNIERYGGPTYFQSPVGRQRLREIFTEKYDVDNPFSSPDIRRKIEDTFIKKYGVNNPFKHPDIKKKIEKTNLKKYGVKNPFLNEDVQEKILNTKRKNGSFNTSFPEEFFDEIIRKHYKLVERNYKKDKRYPFRCDFYIRRRDLFIELNFHKTHTPKLMWYNPRKKSHKSFLEFLMSLSTKFADEHIKIWTKRDPLKRKIAKIHKLNYVVFWDFRDIEKWFELGMPDGHDYDYEYSWIEDEEERKSWIKSKP